MDVFILIVVLLALVCSVFFLLLSNSLFRNMFQMAQSDDLDNDIDELLQEFESRCQRTILHTVVFY